MSKDESLDSGASVLPWRECHVRQWQGCFEILSQRPANLHEYPELSRGRLAPGELGRPCRYTNDHQERCHRQQKMSKGERPLLVSHESSGGQ